MPNLASDLARVMAAGWLNAEGSYLSDEKRGRMIEAGKREGASIGEVTFGKIAQAHDIPLYAGYALLRDLAETWRSRINVDPEDPYEHGVSDTLMTCRDELLALLDGKRIAETFKETPNG